LARKRRRNEHARRKSVYRRHPPLTPDRRASRIKENVVAMKLLSSTVVYSTPIFQVAEEAAASSDGFEIRRAILHHPGAAGMFVVDDQERVLLVRQYRLAAREFLWEIPAGRHDPGETPLETAKRELAEETGYRAQRWKRLLAFYPVPSYSQEKLTVFYATGPIPGKAHPMEDERIESRWVPALTMERWIQRGTIREAKTIIAYFVWRNKFGAARQTATSKSKRNLRKRS
jgi:ADP-ribose pyrophosphatase